MSTSVILSARDLAIFDDIMKFGFITCEYFNYRFSASVDVGRHIVARLIKKNYLRAIGKFEPSNRKYYVPDYNLYTLIHGKEIVKMNPFLIEHDEYLLKLYSTIKSKSWDITLKLEQEFKKNNEHKKMLRVPDLAASMNGILYIFEYEKTQKNSTLLKTMKSAFSRYNEDETCFIFICETEKIARTLLENMRFKHQVMARPQELLESLKANNFEKIAQFLKDEKVRYF